MPKPGFENDLPNSGIGKIVVPKGLMKGQDVVIAVLLAVSPPRGNRFDELAGRLKVSASDAHRAVRRLVEAGLVVAETLEVRRANLEEFLVHGLRYVFPAPLDGDALGVPTAHSALPLSKRISAGRAAPLVWPSPKGTIRGSAIAPLYRTAPEAALADSSVHELLALLDALRVGRARDVAIAREELSERLGADRS